jgi:dipeptidyl aminopeptidase/acylaminoacyl peptidase
LTIALTGERKIETFADQPGSNQYDAAFSPDGRWVAYVSNEGQGGINRVYVQQFPAGAKYQISRERSEAPVWSPDGKELVYYQVEAAKLVAVRIQMQPSFSFGDPIPLPIERMIQTRATPRQYDITPDGKRFLVLLPAPQSGTESRATQQIHVVLNWFEELKQRVPIKNP